MSRKRPPLANRSAFALTCEATTVTRVSNAELRSPSRKLRETMPVPSIAHLNVVIGAAGAGCGKRSTAGAWADESESRIVVAL